MRRSDVEEVVRRELGLGAETTLETRLRDLRDESCAFEALRVDCWFFGDTQANRRRQKSVLRVTGGRGAVVLLVGTAEKVGDDAFDLSSSELWIDDAVVLVESPSGASTTSMETVAKRLQHATHAVFVEIFPSAESGVTFDDVDPGDDDDFAVPLPTLEKAKVLQTDVGGKVLCKVKALFDATTATQDDLLLHAVRELAVEKLRTCELKRLVEVLRTAIVKGLVKPQNTKDFFRYFTLLEDATRETFHHDLTPSIFHLKLAAAACFGCFSKKFVVVKNASYSAVALEWHALKKKKKKKKRRWSRRPLRLEAAAADDDDDDKIDKDDDDTDDDGESRASSSSRSLLRSSSLRSSSLRSSSSFPEEEKIETGADGVEYYDIPAWRDNIVAANTDRVLALDYDVRALQVIMTNTSGKVLRKLRCVKPFSVIRIAERNSRNGLRGLITFPRPDPLVTTFLDDYYDDHLSC